VFEGLIGLLILVADVWAILNVFQSNESTGSKVVLCGPQDEPQLEAHDFARRNRRFETALWLDGGLCDG